MQRWRGHLKNAIEDLATFCRIIFLAQKYMAIWFPFPSPALSNVVRLLWIVPKESCSGISWFTVLGNFGNRNQPTGPGKPRQCRSVIRLLANFHGIWGFGKRRFVALIKIEAEFQFCLLVLWIDSGGFAVSEISLILLKNLYGWLFLSFLIRSLWNREYCNIFDVIVNDMSMVHYSHMNDVDGRFPPPQQKFNNNRAVIVLWWKSQPFHRQPSVSCMCLLYNKTEVSANWFPVSLSAHSKWNQRRNERRNWLLFSKASGNSGATERLKLRT